MADFKERLVHLHSCRSMNWKRIHRLLADDQNLTNIYHYSEHDLKSQLQLSTESARTLYYDLHQVSPNDILTYYRKKEITPITINDTSYPQLLAQIYDPPFVLYARGRLELLKQEKRLAVVGTRKPTKVGLQTLIHLIPPLVNERWTIVSGLALGIDAYSHRLTIEAGGQTIAVLGCGFDFIYPRENQTLFDEMANNQLLLSEYPPFVPPKKWHFPARNRIISGLSTAVLVVEAKERSGSLITADQALEQGRDVFAIPGSIFSPQSVGTNRLIQQGAKLVLTAEDIMHESAQLFFPNH